MPRMPALPLSSSSTTVTATDRTLPNSQHLGLPSTRFVVGPLLESDVDRVELFRLTVSLFDDVSTAS